MLQVNTNGCSSQCQRLQLIGKSRLHDSKTKMRMLTHDLASPLTVIKLNLDLLAPTLKSRNMEIARIYKGIDYIEKIIEQELSKGNEDKHKSWSVNKVINEVISLHSHNFKGNKIQIVKKYFDDRRYTDVPASALFRVVNNIIDNALSALSEVQDDRRRRIWIAVSKEAEMLKITIRDNGVGVPIEMQKGLFSKQSSTKEKGHGLGLVGSVKLLKMYFNGSLEYRDNTLAESGAVFEITLY